MALANILFTDWHQLAAIAVKGLLAYAAVVAAIRICGNRSTSRMNNFDWIVTVAVGSLLASTVLTADVPLFEGVTAIVVLLALQFAVTFATSRWRWARKLVMAEPTLLYFRGEFLHQAMRRERVSQGEVMSAIRESGIGSKARAAAIVLEPDANLAVIKGDVPDNFPQQLGLP